MDDQVSQEEMDALRTIFSKDSYVKAAWIDPTLSNQYGHLCVAIIYELGSDHYDSVYTQHIIDLFVILSGKFGHIIEPVEMFLDIWSPEPPQELVIKGTWEPSPAGSYGLPQKEWVLPHSKKVRANVVKLWREKCQYGIDPRADARRNIMWRDGSEWKTILWWWTPEMIIELLESDSPFCVMLASAAPLLISAEEIDKVSPT